VLTHLSNFILAIFLQNRWKQSSSINVLAARRRMTNFQKKTKIGAVRASGDEPAPFSMILG
jgi:hypothetical protein